MSIPLQPKSDRFQAYNAQQRKNPPTYLEYPKMLTNPEDGATRIVQDEEEHRALVGDRKFEAQPYWGPSARAAPEKIEKTRAPEHAPEINVPETARQRRGLKAVSLDGETGTVGPQTVFADVPPVTA